MQKQEKPHQEGAGPRLHSSHCGCTKEFPRNQITFPKRSASIKPTQFFLNFCSTFYHTNLGFSVPYITCESWRVPAMIPHLKYATSKISLSYLCKYFGLEFQGTCPYFHDSEVPMILRSHFNKSFLPKKISGK